MKVPQIKKINTVPTEALSRRLTGDPYVKLLVPRAADKKLYPEHVREQIFSYAEFEADFLRGWKVSKIILWVKHDYRYNLERILYLLGQQGYTVEVMTNYY